MANDIKYKPQIWGEPIEGERLSTNGHYTGEQRGTTTQDALVEMPKYYVEETIIRRGTITQDVLNKIEQASDYVEIGSLTVISKETAYDSDYHPSQGYFPEGDGFTVSVGQYISFEFDTTGATYKVTEVLYDGIMPEVYFDGEYTPQYGETVTVYKDPNAWTCGNCGSTNYNEDLGACGDCYYTICPDCGEWYSIEMFCDNCGYGSTE